MQRFGGYWGRPGVQGLGMLGWEEQRDDGVQCTVEGLEVVQE